MLFQDVKSLGHLGYVSKRRLLAVLNKISEGDDGMTEKLLRELPPPNPQVKCVICRKKFDPNYNDTRACHVEHEFGDDHQYISDVQAVYYRMKMCSQREYVVSCRRCPAKSTGNEDVVNGDPCLCYSGIHYDSKEDVPPKYEKLIGARAAVGQFDDEFEDFVDNSEDESVSSFGDYAGYGAHSDDDDSGCGCVFGCGGDDDESDEDESEEDDDVL